MSTLAVGEGAVDVGEAGSVAHLDLDETRANVPEPEPRAAGEERSASTSGILAMVLIVAQRVRNQLDCGVSAPGAGVEVGDNRGVVISSPFAIILSAAEKAVLSARATSARAEHRMVVRARIVLAAAEGHTNAAIAADQGMHVDTVRKWRRRFHERRIEGLADLRRSGRPVGFTAAQVAEVKALACTPSNGDRCAAGPLVDRGSWPLRPFVRGLVEDVSASTVGRWLAADAIKPWQHRSWISPEIPTSQPRPPACSTSMSAGGKASSSARMSTSSAPTRSRNCKRCVVATAGYRPHRAAPDAWSSNTAVAGRLPTSPPTTSTALT